MKKNEDGYIFCINTETNKTRYMAPAFVASKESMKWGGWKVWEAEAPTPANKTIDTANKLLNGEQPQENEVDILEDNAPINFSKITKELKNELIILKAENENLKARIETLGNELANKPKLKRKRKYTRKEKPA